MAFLAIALRADADASAKIAPGDFVELGVFVHAPRTPKNIKGPEDRPFYILAERVRFELTGPVRGRRFSRPVHSTALPPLRVASYYPHF